MTRDAKLYRLVLGRTLAQLRERRGLRQAVLAARAQIPPASMCRIEKGQGQADAFALRKLGAVLRIDQTALAHLADEACARTEKAARQMIRGLGKTWWQEAQKQVGDKGMEALVTFAVAAVMAEEQRAA